eukprot:scaffold198707_cov50-Attheya_sp.AAC.3
MPVVPYRYLMDLAMGVVNAVVAVVLGSRVPSPPFACDCQDMAAAWAGRACPVEGCVEVCEWVGVVVDVSGIRWLKTASAASLMMSAWSERNVVANSVLPRGNPR